MTYSFEALPGPVDFSQLVVNQAVEALRVKVPVEVPSRIYRRFDEYVYQLFDVRVVIDGWQGDLQIRCQLSKKHLRKLHLIIGLEFRNSSRKEGCHMLIWIGVHRASSRRSQQFREAKVKEGDE